MARALIGKLYPDLSKPQLTEKANAIVDRLYAIRDSYWKLGGVPQEEHPKLKQALEAQFRRDGLERTLMQIGLNPLDANLDNNGISGKAAKSLSAGQAVSHALREYRQAFDARWGASPDKPASAIQTPLAEAPHRLSDATQSLQRIH